MTRRGGHGGPGGGLFPSRGLRASAARGCPRTLATVIHIDHGVIT